MAKLGKWFLVKVKHFTKTFSFSCVFSFRVALWSVPCLHPIKLLHSVIPLQSPSLPSHWPKPVKFVLTCKAPYLLFVPLYSPHRGGCSLPFRLLGLFHAEAVGTAAEAFPTAARGRLVMGSRAGLAPPSLPEEFLAEGMCSTPSSKLSPAAPVLPGLASEMPRGRAVPAL